MKSTSHLTAWKDHLTTGDVVRFSFPVDDPDNPYAFNVEQAQIAIGNGGLTGMGLYQGTQTRSNLVPEQQTDFIFTVAGEELGFRGAGTLLLLYALLLYRIWTTAQEANDQFDQLLCIGVLAMFMFQIFQSVGMTMGMMPVTGIPLPLVSYGGSSMVTSMVGLGLVHGVASGCRVIAAGTACGEGQHGRHRERGAAEGRSTSHQFDAGVTARTSMTNVRASPGWIGTPGGESP